MKKFLVSRSWFLVKKATRQPRVQNCLFSELETRNQKLETGFTLLEIVVAMAIVGIGIVAVLEIFSLGLRLAGASSTRTAAVAYSREAIDSFLIRKSFDTRGDSGNFGRSVRWRIDADSVRDDSQDAPANWDVSEITLSLSYPDAERDKLVEMKTLRIVKHQSR